MPIKFHHETQHLRHPTNIVTITGSSKPIMQNNQTSNPRRAPSGLVSRFRTLDRTRGALSRVAREFGVSLYPQTDRDVRIIRAQLDIARNATWHLTYALPIAAFSVAIASISWVSPLKAFCWALAVTVGTILQNFDIGHCQNATTIPFKMLEHGQKSTLLLRPLYPLSYSPACFSNCGRLTNWQTMYFSCLSLHPL